MTETQPKTANTHKRGIRCGWCLNGCHESCAVTVNLNSREGSKPRLWNCSCNCNTTGKYTPGHPRTRCIACGRRDVKTGENGRCVDTTECQGFVEDRRAKNPQWQALQTIHKDRMPEKHPRPEAHSKLESVPKTPKTPKTPKAKTGQCRCCNEPTKGGQFLPGHDARYVSQQAKLIVEQNRQDLLAARLDDLSPSMFAKLTKRVETLRKETTR